MIPEKALAAVFDLVAAKKDLETACLMVGVSFDAVLRILEAGMIEQENVHNGGRALKANADDLKVWLWWCRARVGAFNNPFTDDVAGA